MPLDSEVSQAVADATEKLIDLNEDQFIEAVMGMAYLSLGTIRDRLGEQALKGFIAGAWREPPEVKIDRRADYESKH